MPRHLNKEDCPALSIRPEQVDVTEPSSMFSSIRVRKFMRNSKGRYSATLPRAQSFPAAHYSLGHKPNSDHRSSLNWAPAPIPVTNARLEISLGKSISTGRIGLVYKVKVLRVVDSITGGELPLEDFNLPPMCVKIAPPQYCRSLAREAWMYEQLSERDGYQGTVVPRCWGFFSADLHDLVKANRISHTPFPWSENMSDQEDDFKRDLLNDDDPRSNDDDQVTTPLPTYCVDVNGDRARSPWNTWRHQPEHPTVSLLLLECLGERYQIYPAPKTSVSDDLEDVLDDLTSSGVWHQDITFRNVLRASPDATNVCSRHKRKHGWRLIDFDRALKADNSYYEWDLIDVAATYRYGATGGNFLDEGD